MRSIYETGRTAHFARVDRPVEQARLEASKRLWGPHPSSRVGGNRWHCLCQTVAASPATLFWPLSPSQHASPHPSPTCLPPSPPPPLPPTRKFSGGGASSLPLSPLGVWGMLPTFSVNQRGRRQRRSQGGACYPVGACHLELG